MAIQNILTSPSREFDILLGNDFLGRIKGYSDPWQRIFFYKANWEKGGLCLASLPLTVRQTSHKLEVYMADAATPTLFFTPKDRVAATKLNEAHRKAATDAATTSAAIAVNRNIQFGTQPVTTTEPANLEITLPQLQITKEIDWVNDFPSTPPDKTARRRPAREFRKKTTTR